MDSYRLRCIPPSWCWIRWIWKSVGPGQFAFSRIPLHRHVVRGGIEFAFTCRSSLSAPCAVRPGLRIENFCIRFDDPVRVHRSGARGSEQSAKQRDARRIGKSVGPLQSDARPKAATAPALGPGHEVGGVPGAAPSRRRAWKWAHRGVDGDLTRRSAFRTLLAEAPVGMRHCRRYPRHRGRR